MELNPYWWKGVLAIQSVIVIQRYLRPYEGWKVLMHLLILYFMDKCFEERCELSSEQFVNNTIGTAKIYGGWKAWNALIASFDMVTVNFSDTITKQETHIRGLKCYNIQLTALKFFFCLDFLPWFWSGVQWEVWRGGCQDCGLCWIWKQVMGVVTTVAENMMKRISRTLTTIVQMEMLTISVIYKLKLNQSLPNIIWEFMFERSVSFQWRMCFGL